MPRLYLYARGPRPTWYIGGFPSGKKQRSTGFAGPASKGKAERLMAVEQKALDDEVAKTGSLGPMTVARWAPLWLEGLRAGNEEGDYRQYERRLANHVLPIIGRTPLAELTADHVLKVLAGVKAKAPRTRRNVYRMLKPMFKKAVPKHLAVNPCLTVEADHSQHLPPNEDKDPEWRAGAVFARPEVETLIFDERIAEDRRMYYGLLFLLGTRLSEISALKRAAYRPVPAAVPLGKMVVAWSYNTETKRVKRVKTHVTREVPVHDLLAELLKAWLAPGGGRERLVAMAPGKDADLIVPSREGGHRNRHTVYAAMQRDLVLVGLRPRRVHDTRRTFISLTMNKGGHKDLLRFITHGRSKSADAFDLYHTPAWSALCGEVCKLEVGRPQQEAAAIPLRKYANSRGEHLQATYSPVKGEEKPMVTPALASSPCSASDPFLTQHQSARRGQSNQIAGLADGQMGQDGANLSHFCPAVSESRKALTALQRGDIEAAKAILTALAARARRAR